MGLTCYLAVTLGHPLMPLRYNDPHKTEVTPQPSKTLRLVCLVPSAGPGTQYLPSAQPMRTWRDWVSQRVSRGEVMREPTAARPFVGGHLGSSGKCSLQAKLSHA